VTLSGAYRTLVGQRAEKLRSVLTRGGQFVDVASHDLSPRPPNLFQTGSVVGLSDENLTAVDHFVDAASRLASQGQNATLQYFAKGVRSARVAGGRCEPVPPISEQSFCEGKSQGR
jgi:hypothetical protein